MAEKTAVILLSGGLDSATTLAVARSERFRCCALTFLYGQRHRCEVEAAKRVAKSLGAARHRCIEIDLAAFGASALTDHNIDVPKDGADLGESNRIPATYGPARKKIFFKLRTRLGGGTGCLRYIYRCQHDRLQRLSRLPGRIHIGF